MNLEHVCAGDGLACPDCGYTFDNYSIWSDGTRTYGTTRMRDLYRALYGEPPANMFIPAAGEPA